MPAPLNIVFAGTPEFAAQHLAALLNAGHSVSAVYTQPDRPAGRGQKLLPSSVKALALEQGLSVYQPTTLRDVQAQEALAALRPDLLIVVAYGLILPQAVLDIPRLGCYNSHASLLPRWRGAAPIQRAIEAGDAQTGITLMRMEAGLDTGPMLLRHPLPIGADETGGQLHDRLAELGAATVLEGLELLTHSSPAPELQDDAQATYAHKLSKAEARLQWAEPAQVLDRRIRAFHPWPLCETQLGERLLKVHAARLAAGSGVPGLILEAQREGLRVACGEAALLLTRLQLPGGKALAFADLYQGHRELFTPGQVLR